MNFSFCRATNENGLFRSLECEWLQQIKKYETGLEEEYESPYMEHARKIVSETPPDPRYGIFVLTNDAATDGERHVAMAHVNHAWPGTSHATLRMVWIVLAPRFDFEDVSPDVVGDVVAAFLYKGIALCEKEMLSEAMKMHLGNMVDRQFAQGLVLGLRRDSPLEVEVRGNWLHIENIRQRSE
ncbi:MAG: hypothetical protein LDL39_11265 [Magnetospirillum sp.]|nr:hypothetical protein [Magnetospirillum sp.]